MKIEVLHECVNENASVAKNALCSNEAGRVLELIIMKIWRKDFVSLMT